MKIKNRILFSVSTLLILIALVILISSFAIIITAPKIVKVVKIEKEYLLDKDCEIFKLEDIKDNIVSTAKSLAIVLSNKELNSPEEIILFRMVCYGSSQQVKEGHIFIQVVLGENNSLYTEAGSWNIVSGSIITEGPISTLYIDLSDASSSSSIIQMWFEEKDVNTVKAWLGDGPNYYCAGGSYVKHVIAGGTGDDYIATGPADDIIFGSDGQDFIMPFMGKDYIAGGKGVDTVVCFQDIATLKNVEYQQK